MPNERYLHTESFTNAIRAVGDFLKQKFSDSLKSLSDKDLKKYHASHYIVRGWSIRDEGLGIFLRVLIPDQFPYAVPRIAIESIDDKTRDFSKEWPHVEEKGILCLPSLNPSTEKPDALVNELLRHAIGLITKFSQDPAAAEQDFQKEFISYWNRQKNERARPILSLLDTDSETKQIITGFTPDGCLFVGDENEASAQWFLNRHGRRKRSRFARGLFVRLDYAPVPPFPTTPKELTDLIEKRAPESFELFQSLILNNDLLVIVLSAPSESGTGLIGICVARDPNDKKPARGFRNVEVMPLDLRLERFNESSEIGRHQVIRVDHKWVHGRGMDPLQEILKDASVAVFGCGALGSHVAVRLAQAGVGKIILVDPEELETANVGRHALGMGHIFNGKAKALCAELRQRFPHISISWYGRKWEFYVKDNPEEFDALKLIVSTIGDFGGEGVLNEWHVKSRYKIPIVYGWLEPQGAAAHAVLVRKPGICLRCLIKDNGEMYTPDSENWPNRHGLQYEPACGAMFQPFGAVDLAFAEALVADLCIGVLTGYQEENAHRVHVTSTSRLHALGGVWTSTHNGFRPTDFTGSFQYERPIETNPDCPFCSP